MVGPRLKPGESHCPARLLTDRWVPLRGCCDRPEGIPVRPDPAVLRAGLVQHLACQLGASRIEPSISLLTSNGNMQSVFARCYRVVEVIPFGLKRIRAALRERGVGSVTLKKRGSAVDTPSFENSCGCAETTMPRFC